MSDLLTRMAAQSARRVTEAKQRESEADLRMRARNARPPVELRWSPLGFDLIAEIKRRAPSAGPLSGAEFSVRARTVIYATAGAVAISVLTEPEEFDGSLGDLEQTAAASRVPVMRKDFLVDPYQIFEARAAGASGALLVQRILDDARTKEMLDAAQEAGLFLLLEAFDSEDIERVRSLVSGAGEHAHLLIGVNARNLETLDVDPARLRTLAPSLPSGLPRVAESGLESADDARRAAAAGYRAALVGGSLMRSDNPGGLLVEMLRSGREEASRSCA